MCSQPSDPSLSGPSSRLTARQDVAEFGAATVRDNPAPLALGQVTKRTVRGRAGAFSVRSPGAGSELERFAQLCAVSTLSAWKAGCDAQQGECGARISGLGRFPRTMGFPGGNLTVRPSFPQSAPCGRPASLHALPGGAGGARRLVRPQLRGASPAQVRLRACACVSACIHPGSAQSRGSNQ